MRVGTYNIETKRRLVDRYSNEEFFAGRAENEPDKIFFLPQDLRWENVFAYAGPPQGYIYQGEDEDAPNPDEYLEFLIEVPLDGTIWYSKQILHKDQIDMANLDIYSWILNEMVEMVDKYMEEGSKDRPCPAGLSDGRGCIREYQHPGPHDWQVKK